MKNFILSLVIAGALSNVFVAKKAEAFGIINILSTGSLDYVGTPRNQGDMIMTTLCIALLPLCILDEEGASDMSVEGLLDNGYSAEEASSIVEGQSAVVSHLKANNLQITVEGDMDASELASELSKIEGSTQAYTEFVSENY